MVNRTLRKQSMKLKLPQGWKLVRSNWKIKVGDKINCYVNAKKYNGDLSQWGWINVDSSDIGHKPSENKQLIYARPNK